MVPSSSSASAGSGENRLDRRGEADPVLVIHEVSSDESPVLWSRPTTDVIPGEDCFPREGGVGGLDCSDSRRREGGRDGLGSSFSRTSFRETCTRYIRRVMPLSKGREGTA